MKPYATLLCLVATAVTFAPARAETGVPPRAVVELFTSQGCSSCPPADKVAAELSRIPGLVVLSMPVDYWDYLGWKDTFADRVFTARQKAYGATRGDGEVYTPQAVVNGTRHVVGSDREALDAATSSGALGVPVTLSRTQIGLHVEVGASQGASRTGAVWLVPVRKNGTVAIGRGENSGKSLTYANIARGLVRLGAWSGGATKFDVSADELTAGGADGYVVLLQSGDGAHPGAILGAAQGG